MGYIIIIHMAILIVMFLHLNGEISASFIEMLIVAAIVTLLVCSTTAGILALTLTEKVYEKGEVVEITVLKDGGNSEEPIYLETGTHEEMRYYYYMVDDNFGTTMEKVAVSNVSIKESSTDKATITTYPEKQSKIHFWLPHRLATKKHVIEIPKGSID